MLILFGWQFDLGINSPLIVVIDIIPASVQAHARGFLGLIYTPFGESLANRTCRHYSSIRAISLTTGEQSTS